MILWGLRGRFLHPFCNSGDLLTEHAVDGGAGHKVALCQLAQALPVLPAAEDRGSIEDQGFATDVPAFELSASHYGAHPLDDQAAFQFCDCTDDDHNGPAERAAGIDLFPEADELDIQSVQFIEHFEEVLHRPGDPIGSPD